MHESKYESRLCDILCTRKVYSPRLYNVEGNFKSVRGGGFATIPSNHEQTDQGKMKRDLNFVTGLIFTYLELTSEAKNQIG